ncbi:MAG: hypothetical protein GY711_03840 [bacterium]|nr:hypothetical protein [bacterium]
MSTDMWPQWRGPTRDGHSPGDGWPAKIGEEHLELDWRVPLGPSYAGPIVSADRVLSVETEGGPRRSCAPSTGRRARSCGRRRRSTAVPALGFVCSPLVGGDHLDVQAGGAFFKLDKRSGETVLKSLADGTPPSTGCWRSARSAMTSVGHIWRWRAASCSYAS